MNSKIPNWMLRESAGCFSKRSGEASQNKTEEKEEMGTRKRPLRTLDSEGGVEEFLCFLERIEEMKKQLQRKRSTNCSGSAGIAEEKDMRMNILPGIKQLAQGSDFVSLAPYQSTSSLWKPSFQWEDFDINPLPVQTDLSGAATTETNNNIGAEAVLMSSMDENHKGGIDNIHIGNARLNTRSLLDIIADPPAGGSHDHVDDLKNKGKDVDAPPDLELRLFPI
uniref:Uncharacterized protein n=1 Tax=Picea sitchensis TaxID=3332 RepID=A9NSA7_PICSI|nr:unknown [Picea sitchensis]